MNLQEYSTTKAFFMSFVPSARSLSVSFGTSAGIIIIHQTLLSLNTGLLLPNLLQGDAELWGEVFISSVEPALEFILQNSMVATTVILLFWALIGAALYKIASSSVAAAKEARNIEDPSLRFYIAMVVWHLVLGALAIGLTYLLWPFAHFLLAQDQLLAQSATWMELIKYLAGGVLGWMLIFHAYVVLYRLLKRFYIY